MKVDDGLSQYVCFLVNGKGNFEIGTQMRFYNVLSAEQ